MYPETTARKKQDADMWIRVVLLILILSAVFLLACASGSRTSKDAPEASPEETITIGFVNSVQTADVWIIPDTEENRKTTVWGTASVKNAEPEKEYPVSIPHNDGDTYLLRMIDKDHIYYESKSVTLLEGYSLIIYRNEENDRDIRLVVHDSDGKELTDESVFNAAL